MCEAIGILKIYQNRPDGFIKGGIEGKKRQGFYIAKQPSIRMQAIMLEGTKVEGRLVRGRLVRIRKL